MCTGRWYCRTLSFWLSLFSTGFPVDTVCVGGCVCPLQRLTHEVATKYTRYFAAREFSITPLLPPLPQLPPSLINRLRFLWTLGPMKTKQKTKTKPLEDRQSSQGELTHQRKKELATVLRQDTERHKSFIKMKHFLLPFFSPLKGREK